MNTSARQELQYAKGMVERRRESAEGIGRCSSKHEAMELYSSMTTCVREVHKHYRNITQSVDNKSAKFAEEASVLLATAKDWRDRSREELIGWGVPANALRVSEHTEVW